MYLLDTDTLIYFLKGHEAVVQNFRDHANKPKAISVVTYGELVYGARKSERVPENMAKVHRLAELYPIIDITRSVMDSLGEIKASLSSNGITVDDFDLQIGCTALMLNYTVVTNNTKHFQKIPGLKLVNWAE
jgi:tRNA(fMet)-specific endonuclease VapC